MAIPLATALQAIASGSSREASLAYRRLRDEDMESVARAITDSLCPLSVVDLQGNELTDASMAVIIPLMEATPSITEWNVSHNYLTDDAGQLLITILSTSATHIRSLIIGGNRLGEAVVKRIQDMCAVNAQPEPLKKLLYILEDADGGTPITRIDLSNSGRALSANILARAITTQDTLQELCLSQCQLGDAGLDIVGLAIAGKKALRALYVDGNGITSHGLQPFCVAMRRNTALETLSLRDNRFADDGILLLLDWLKIHAKCVNIDIEGNAVSSSIMEKLGLALRLNRQPPQLKAATQALQLRDPNVTSLDFNDTPQMLEGPFFLSPFLSGATFLLELRLSNARMGDAGVLLLVKGLRQNTTLTLLHLANNNATDDSGSALASLVKAHPAIFDLNLANNNLTDTTGKALCEALQFNDVLRYINVECNDMTEICRSEIDAFTVINSVPVMLKRLLPRIEGNDPTLTSLNFSEYDGTRYFDSQAVFVLCRALTINGTVLHVDMSNNNIGDVGARELAELLLINTSLQSMAINSCGISSRGARYFVEALRQNSTLTSMSLADNPIDDVAGEQILSLLHDNGTITNVDLSSTFVSAAMQQQIYLATCINDESPLLKHATTALRTTDTTALQLSGAEGRPITDRALSILRIDLEGNSAITAVDLSHNCFGIEGVRVVCALLTHPEGAIASLDLSSNAQIDDACARELAAAMAAAPQLRAVNLADTSITAEGFAAVCDAMEANLELSDVILPIAPTNALILRHKRLGIINAQPRAFKYVVKKLYANDPNVREVAFPEEEGVVVTDTMAAILAFALASNTFVRHVHLPKHRINSQGMKSLAAMLSLNKSIASMDVSGNPVSDDVEEVLLEMLRENNTLVEINTLDTELSEGTVLRLQRALAINAGPRRLKNILERLCKNDESLAEVHLNGNDVDDRPFDDDASIILCDALRHNKVVTFVDVANNAITDTGAMMFASMLTENATIQVVHLENNRITSTGVDVLADMLKRNTSLRRLGLRGNLIPAYQLEEIASLTAVNGQPFDSVMRHEIDRTPYEMLDRGLAKSSTEYFRLIEERLFAEATSHYNRSVRILSQQLPAPPVRQAQVIEL